MPCGPRERDREEWQDVSKQVVLRTRPTVEKEESETEESEVIRSGECGAWSDATKNWDGTYEVLHLLVLNDTCSTRLPKV